MNDLNTVVANNLKRIRTEMKLSFEKASELTGVSKAMLRQIETGESSPTVNTIWKIASGLKIPYTSIINMPQPDTVVVLNSNIDPQIEDDGRYKVYSIFPSENGRKFDVFMLELEEGGYFASESHGPETEEFITVYEGTLMLEVEGNKYHVEKGDSIKFKSDRDHAYQNPSNKLTRLSMVIYYGF
jgi:transcriptional regulator with XRE-family HTH domain